MRITRLLAAIIAPLAVVLAACVPHNGAGTAPVGNSPVYNRAVDPWGPDVSSWQHPAGAPINWAKVRAAGASFAFAKVSEGTSYASRYFNSDLTAARAQGLYVGGYHFARPALPLSSAAQQANYFINLLGTTRLQGWLPPVVDLEVTGGLSPANLTAWTRLFVQTVAARTGRNPIIYTGAYFWRGFLGNPTGFAQYPLWMAAYSNSVSSPLLCGDWKASTFWQYTDSRSVPGIVGPSDASFFRGTRAQLATMANAAW
jgi:lysozyme